MTVKEILKEISAKISALEAERRTLERDVAQEYQEENKDSVGRCFRLDDARYAIITDVPQIRETMAGPKFNKYQFPCLTIDFEDKVVEPWEAADNIVPFYEDMLYSRDGIVFSDGDPFADEVIYEEIPMKVFAAKFDDAVELLKCRMLENIIRPKAGADA